MSWGRSVVGVVAIALLAGACGDGRSDGGLGRRSAGRPATSVPDVGGPETTATPPTPTAPTTTEGIAAGSAQPATATCPPIPAQRQPDPDRPRYVMDIDVRLDENAVIGSLDVRFIPDLSTDRLVFRLWPNGPRPSGAGAALEATSVRLDGDAEPAATQQPDPTTLVVPLDPPLGAGQAIAASVEWRLTLPGPSNDRLAREGDALRLGSFFPVLAWEPGTGWAEDPPTSAFAEASTAPVADFVYSVSVPDGLTALGSGRPVDGRFEAIAHRDVAVSVGRFAIATGTAAAPGPVDVTVGVHEGMGDDPAAYLATTIAALEDFSRRFGPYPYPTHTLALTPGLSGGIEYPSMVLQGPNTGGRTTPHEVGHMWFFSLVGNNQGRDPWLDEGLASYAEARFLGNLAAFQSRSIPGNGRGHTSEPMTFWEARQSSYYRGVYVQGAQALAAVGDPDLVDCALRHYVAANAFRIARPGDLVTALRPIFPDADTALARFGAFP